MVLRRRTHVHYGSPAEPGGSAGLSRKATTSSLLAHGTATRRRSGLAVSRSRTGFLLVLPAVALVTLFFAIPAGLMLWMSFHSWPLLGHIRLNGINNYREMLHDKTFARSLVFTFKYVGLMTPIQLLLGFGLALLVRNRIAGVNAFRTIYFMPVVVGFAAGAYVFYVMLQTQIGVVDTILKATRLTNGNTGWLTTPALALTAVVLLSTWKTVGTSMILYMVGMQGIPLELYEAAKVDGAGWWRREISITVPLLSRTTALVLIITVVWAFLAFDQFFILTQGGPNGTTLTTVLWIYTVAFVRYRLGYSSTLSVVVLLILIVLSVFQMKALRADDGRRRRGKT